MNTRTGYSILEVLIAFAVMSMTLAVLLPGQTQLLGRAGSAAERVLAHEYALSRLEELRIFGINSSTDTYENWQIRQEEIVDNTGRTVTVSVYAASGRVLTEVRRTYGLIDAK